MFKKTAQASILALLFCVVLSCVSPNAVKTDIQGLRADLGKLETVVDQKANSTFVAERIGFINNRTEQTSQLAEELYLWKKSVQAETINYSGAGWVVVGTGVMALIFVGAGLLLIRAFTKRGNMLTLLTRAVKNAGEGCPKVVSEIKHHLRKCVHDSNLMDEVDRLERDRKNLGKFARKVGTFAEQTPRLEV